MIKKWKHIAETETGQFYHLDENFNVWTCDCFDKHGTGTSLCLTLTEDLILEGQLRELEHKIARKRKELCLLVGESVEEGLDRIKKQNND